MPTPKLEEVLEQVGQHLTYGVLEHTPGCRMQKRGKYPGIPGYTWVCAQVHPGITWILAIQGQQSVLTAAKPGVSTPCSNTWAQGGVSRSNT